MTDADGTEVPGELTELPAAGDVKGWLTLVAAAIAALGALVAAWATAIDDEDAGPHPTTTTVMTTTVPPTTGPVTTVTVAPTTAPPTTAPPTTAPPATAPPATDPERFPPDDTTTGHDESSVLIVESGKVTLDTPGEVYENRRLTGVIEVRAPDVVIRNVHLTSTGRHGIRNYSTGLLIEDTTVEGRNDATCENGIAFNHYTARRVDVSGCADGFKGHAEVTITDSWCHDLDKHNEAGGGTSHNDCLQGTGGANIVVTGNNFEAVPNEQTSAVKISAFRAPVSNVVIDGNWFSGGTIGLYLNEQGQGVPTDSQVTNNIFDMSTIKWNAWRIDGDVLVEGNVLVNDD